MVFTMICISFTLYTTIDSDLNETIHDNYVEKVTSKVTKMSNDKKEFILEMVILSKRILPINLFTLITRLNLTMNMLAINLKMVLPRIKDLVLNDF